MGADGRRRKSPIEKLLDAAHLDLDAAAYATAFRYSLTPAPKIEELRGMLVTLGALHALAAAELIA